MLRVRWKDFELPTRVAIDEGQLTTTQGRFIVEPFEQGFGATVRWFDFKLSRHPAGTFGVNVRDGDQAGIGGQAAKILGVALAHVTYAENAHAQLRHKFHTPGNERPGVRF